MTATNAAAAEPPAIPLITCTREMFRHFWDERIPAAMATSVRCYKNASGYRACEAFASHGVDRYRIVSVEMLDSDNHTFIRRLERTGATTYEHGPRLPLDSVAVLHDALRWLTEATT